MADTVYKLIPAAQATNRPIKALTVEQKAKVKTTINKFFTLLKAAYA